MNSPIDTAHTYVTTMKEMHGVPPIEGDVSAVATFSFAMSELADAHYSDALGSDHEAGVLAAITAAAAAYAKSKGCDDPWDAMRKEYEHAKAKHGDHTFDNPDMPFDQKYMALAEEVGEVAAAQTYDNAADTGHQAHLIEEIIQVGGLAAAWIAGIVEVHDSEEESK